INIANNLNISRSKFIYPVAMIANIATACTFLGQGAANMNWSDVMVNMGGPVPFGIWDFTIARIPVIVTTIIYGVFVSQYLLPDIPNSQFDTGKPVVEKTKTIDVKKQRIAQIICSFTIIGMIVLDYFSLVPMYIVACIGAVLLILFGVLSEMEAISSIHGPTMFLFIGVLPLSDALKMTGAADVVASLMRTLLGNTTNPYIIMAVLFVVPLILTQVMSNIAAVAVFVPLVCSVAVSIGIDPRAGVMAVLIASCTSILTPMAAAAQAMILAPGGYSMKDYLKCGFPLVLINTVVCIVVLPILFPF
ncbi:MAG TPA: anion permease, partial [Candidatus Ventrisoma faecale]|nr:anion permease [Candidatus Ventrisoma faecale]